MVPPSAHGFFTLSLLAVGHGEIDVYPSDAKQVVNYGLDKVRFIAPVPAGTSVRVRVTLEAVEETKPGKFVFKTLNTIERDSDGEAVLIAESLAMIMA